MKKYLLTLIIFAFSSTMLIGQSLSLSWEDVEIANGDTIYVYGELTEDLFYIMASHAVVTNNSDRTLQVKVKRTEIDVVEGSINMFCWGACFPPDIDISPEPTPIEAGASTDDYFFYGDYVPQGNNGTSIIKYTFFNTDDEEDEVAMTVFYVVSPASLYDLQARTTFGNAYPNPARNQVSFDFELPSGLQSASIRIFNMLGKKVSEVAINSGMRRVAIPVHEFGEGLYFYSLVINGETTSTRKLVIQR
jgi:hypothetical protein